MDYVATSDLHGHINVYSQTTMNRRFLLALVVALAMGGAFGGVSFAAASFASVTPPATAAPEVAKPGGWSKFGALLPADKVAFNEAMSGLVGVHYEPLAVRKQVVAGMNYDFFCNARVVYPGSAWYPAMVHVYKPLQGKPVVKIKKIESP